MTNVPFVRCAVAITAKEVGLALFATEEGLGVVNLPPALAALLPFPVLHLFLFFWGDLVQGVGVGAFHFYLPHPWDRRIDKPNEAFVNPPRYILR